MYIYIGNYIDSGIAHDRCLPSGNAAASNRMYRLAAAMAFGGGRVLIISPGSAMRMRFGGRFFHGGRMSRRGSVAIFHCPTVGVPFLGAFVSFFSVACSVFAVLLRRRILGMFTYCYYPSTILSMLVYRAYSHQVLVGDFEDICIPDYRDLRGGTGAGFVFQIWGWLLMQAAFALVDRAIVPSSTFMRHIPSGVVAILITGCLLPEEICLDVMPVGNRRIKVLLGGKLDVDQGAYIFSEMLHALDLNPVLAAKFEFFITGYGECANHIRESVQGLNNLKATYLGFVSSGDYIRILSAADVCLVMQDAYGRYATSKTPSKFYEYMGAGKCVVSSLLPDYVDLPRGAAVFIQNYDFGSFFRVLVDLDEVGILNAGRLAAGCALDNWSLSSVSARLSDFVNNPNYRRRCDCSYI